MMSPEHRYLNFALIVSVLFLMFAPNAAAETAKEQLQGSMWKGKEEEFVSVFTDFVEHSYMSTLGSYRGEKIVYDHDRSDGESAEVDTRVVGGEGNPIKIEYKLHLTDGQWMVYDAVIDDVIVNFG